jgi:hypothetical protein
MATFQRDAGLTIVLLLVDKHMVADRRWSGYTNELSRREEEINRNDYVDSPYAKIYPVSMDEKAFRLPGAISARNFLRITETSDERIANHG